MLSKVKLYWESFLHLFFPDLCAACMREIPVSGDVLCVYCNHDLPLCGFPSLTDNLVHWRLAGRALPIWASSYMFFKEGNVTQALLHQLKYRGKQYIGEEFGRRHGEYILSQLPAEWRPDYIIPVPLHPKRLHERGFNQSTCYARGLSEAMRVKVREDILVRRKYTETQTRKSKQDRIKNVSDAFQLRDAEGLTGKTILIVDDVFTSGATLEACILPFHGLEEVKVSIATLAIADDW